MRLRTSLLVIAGFAAIAVAAAQADDFNPPPWRDGPLTVAAEWEFVGQDLYDMPPDYMNTVGDGIHVFNTDCFTHAHFENCFWEPDPADPANGRVFTTDAPGRILFFLCNWIDYYPYKYIWVQITYGGMGTPFVQEVIAPNPGTNEWPNPLYGHRVESGGAPGFATEYWYLSFNPDREYVNVILPPNTWIDQVWIDTISTFTISAEDMSWGGIKNLYR